MQARCPIPDTRESSDRPAEAATQPRRVGRQQAVDEQGMRRRTLIAAAVFATILIPLIVIAAIVLQGPGVTSIHDPTKLPERISLCGRQYRGGQEPARTLEAIRSDGLPVVLVDTGPLAPCPAGPLAAAVYVRVGTDAYVSYELFGGL
jgi:hypothetical protein